MNLLAGYSDSESDGETPPAPKLVAKPTAKSAFQKVVDRSNPGRIKVNLPGGSQSRSEKDDIQDDAPPAKKPRLGRGSSFGGFNAMLPAPKKPNVNAISTSEGSKTGSRALGKGLASGVNLKTGAEPAFKRESKVETEEYDETGNPIKKEPMKREDFRAMLNLPTPKSETKPETTTQETREELEPHQASKPTAPRFVPMSVGKGKKKKKPVAPRPTTDSNETSIAISASASTPQAQQPTPETKPRKLKVSLFSVSNETETVPKETSDGQYQPLLYGAEEGGHVAMPEGGYGMSSVNQAAQYAAPSTGGPGPDELTNVASELNLSESERRQLFGKKRRSGPDFQGAKIKDFNTDMEYAHNEKLRQQGEAVQHNPLKSISGTGKNSLRSLVNVATTQKDALKDHFATGARNKREAGNRYGW